MSLIEDLVIASRTLAEHGVIDAYGHASVRSDQNAQHYFELFELARRNAERAPTTGPTLISRTDPDYPPGPAAQRIHGKVELAVTTWYPSSPSGLPSGNMHM